MNKDKGKSRPKDDTSDDRETNLTKQILDSEIDDRGYRRQRILHPRGVQVKKHPLQPSLAAGGNGENLSSKARPDTFNDADISKENRSDEISQETLNHELTTRQSMLDINALLTRLANKEMELLESKRRVQDLERQLNIENESVKKQSYELGILKERIGMHLRGKSLNSSPKKPKMKSQSKYSQSEHQRLSSSGNGKRNSNTDQGREQSSIWRSPLQFLNQMDQIIQQGVEKTFYWEDGDQASKASFKSKTDTVDGSAGSLSVKPDKQEELRSNSRVSTTLWSIVNDVKSGWFGEIDDAEEEHEVDPKHNMYKSTPNANASSTSLIIPSSKDSLDMQEMGIKEFKSVNKQKQARKSPREMEMVEM